jgi:hypothetical protein
MKRQSITHFGSWIQAMKIKYFRDTDTLYIEFKAVRVVETNDLDEKYHSCADIPNFSFEQVPAKTEKSATAEFLRR